VVTASRFLYHDLRVRSTTNLSQDPARSTFYVLVVHDEVVEDEEPLVCTTLRRRELDSNLRFLTRAVSVLPVRDRRFESSSLQRRVGGELDFDLPPIWETVPPASATVASQHAPVRVVATVTIHAQDGPERQDSHAEGDAAARVYR